MKNLLPKLQKIRIDLQNMNLKKSGENKFAKFMYYELSDILPSINSLCFKEKISTHFYIENDLEIKNAILEIIDIESNETLTFTVPFLVPEIRGANIVQNLGGAITYLRRYLF
jgi:hypothetical protein